MQKNTKIFDVDGIKMQFDSDTFNKIFSNFVKKDKCKIQKLEAHIGSLINVSKDAIHSWRFGQNAPSNIELVKDLADFFELTDYKRLLKAIKEDKEMQISERQKDSLKLIYDAVIDFLIYFEKTDGYNNLWYDFIRSGVEAENVENRLYDLAEAQQEKVIQVLQKEYIVIHKLDLYPQLEEFIYDDLCEIYNEKLSYAYRFEAGVEKIDGTRDTVTTMEDYTAALNKINNLLDPYMS